jgi:SAM-dependent methyltransferase
MAQSPSPAKLLDIATGYQRAKVLFALIELGIPTLLAEGPRTADWVATRTSLDSVAADRFLSACVALGLLQRQGDRYANAPDTQRYLVHGTETDLSQYFSWQDEICYPAWSRFATRLREWQPGCQDRSAAGNGGANDGASRASNSDATERAASTRSHHPLSVLLAEALTNAVDLSRHHQVLDLGGGSGAASIALCRRHPNLRAIVLELPEIAAVAREFVARSGLADRIEVREGDFMKGPLPSGCDVALLANVMALSTAEGNCGVLRRVYDALPSGGIVLISGWMLDDDRDHSPLRALFCLEDIRWGSPDVERCAATYSEWLESAGFTGIRRSTQLEPASVMIGRKE